MSDDDEPAPKNELVDAVDYLAGAVDRSGEGIAESLGAIADAILQAFGRDAGRDIGFLGEIAMNSDAGKSIASALHRIADHLEGKESE